MELKTFFDPQNAEKAHQDTILAGPVLPAGLKAPFDHAWGYLDKPGEMDGVTLEKLSFKVVNGHGI